VRPKKALQVVSEFLERPEVVVWRLEAGERRTENGARQEEAAMSRNGAEFVGAC
jgi:hypothetical protein